MSHQDLHEVQREVQSSVPGEEQFYTELCVEDHLESSMAEKELWVLIHNQFNMSQGALAARKENGTLGYMNLQGRGSCLFTQHWRDHPCSSVLGFSVQERHRCTEETSIKGQKGA